VENRALFDPNFWIDRMQEPKKIMFEPKEQVLLVKEPP